MMDTSMHSGPGLMDAIVLLAFVFVIVFSVAWLRSPRLRAWIERPKYRFQANLHAADSQRYDQSNVNRNRAS